MSYRMSRHHASEHADYMCPYEQIKQVNNTRELLTQFGAPHLHLGATKPGRKSTKIVLVQGLTATVYNLLT